MATELKEIARKITIATVTGGAKSWFETLMDKFKGTTMPLMSVFGIATRTTHGAGDFGMWTKFHGTFRATNLQTGEITNSSIVMLPPHLGGALEGALAGEGAHSVQFAFEIHAKYDLDSTTKYSYVVFDKMPPSASDPLAQLANTLGMGDSNPKLAANDNPIPEGGLLEDGATKAAEPAKGNRKR